MRTLPLDAGALGEDGDAPLALQVVGVHGPFLDLLVVAHGAGLLEELVHKRGFAMVDMGDDGDIPNVHVASRGGPTRSHFARMAGLIDGPESCCNREECA